MVAAKVVVVNETGIHARPASNLINLAKQFNSNIMVRNLSRENSSAVNAKSIVMILSLAISKGMEIEITADGPDERQAIETLTSFVESGLGE